MKRRLQLIMAPIFMVWLGLTAYGQSLGGEFTTSDGIRYKITATAPAQVEILRYTGTATEVTIPPTVNDQVTGYQVTSIGDDAFNEKQLTSVTIPEGVTHIGARAFQDNRNMNSLAIPSTVASIGNNAFWNCHLSSLEIPEGITDIGDNAFGRNNLTSVTIPASVTSIGNNAFITLPNSSSKMTELIMLGSAPPTLGANSFTARGEIDVTVPFGALAAYQDDVNWTDFKSIGEPPSFITTWQVEAGGSVTLPINSGYAYDFLVDWGDGTPVTAIATTAPSDPNDPRLTHTYTNANTYGVRIYGKFPSLYFNNGGDRDKIRTVEQWGDIQWETMRNAFSGCADLDITATDAPDLQNVTDMQGMFNASGVTGQQTELNSWDTSNVTTMLSMFQNASSFDQDIGNWNVGNVTNMLAMFNGASAFNGDIGNWEVGNVTNMRAMFQNASGFDQDISGWEVGNVTTMRFMFNRASSFNGDISGWNVSNVTNMGVMFQGASAFNRDIGGWDVVNVTRMDAMFNRASSFNGDIGNWNVVNVTRMDAMFNGASTFNQDIGGWNVGQVTDMGSMLNGSNLSIANYGATLQGWADLPNTPTGITLGAGGLGYGPIGAAHRQELEDNYGWTITGDTDLLSVPPFITTWAVDAADASITIPIHGEYAYDFIVDWGDHTTTTIDTSNPNDARLTHTYAGAGTYQVSIYGDFPALHFNNAGDRDKIRTVDQWGAIQWESMLDTFEGCTHLDIFATDAPNLQNVADMSGMFRGSGITGQHTDLNSWDVSNVTDMGGMFQLADHFNQDISGWNVGNVTTMGSMFAGATHFDQDISGWNVSNVTDMGWMFNGAVNFNQDIGGWDISNVTDMGWMLSNSSLSKANYGTTLAGWAALPNTPTGIELGAHGLVYDNEGAIHRQKLTGEYQWTITGDIREEDNEAPTVVLAPSITLVLDEHGRATLLATQLDNGSTDNRTAPENLRFSFDVDGNETDRIFGCGDLGDHQMTLYVTDEGKNLASAATTVTVEAYLGNLVALAKDITVQLDAHGQVSITPGQVNDGSSYGCGSTPNLSLDRDTFSCDDVGSPVPVTLTAAQGNQTATAAALVTVEGPLNLLVAMAKDITVQLDADGQATILPGDVDNGSGRSGCNNNSDPIFISLDKTTFSCDDVDTPVRVILTATQGSETATATALVTVEANGNCELGPLADFNRGFSPNGDGIGDTLVIEGLEAYRNNVVRIYDLSQRLLFSAHYGGPEDAWDGTDRDGLVPVGSYVCVIDYNEPGLGHEAKMIYVNY